MCRVRVPPFSGTALLLAGMLLAGTSVGVLARFSWSKLSKEGYTYTRKAICQLCRLALEGSGAMSTAATPGGWLS